MSKDFEAYIEAAMVACPVCKAPEGVPCQEGYCKNGYQNCPYNICYRIRDKEQPHLQRAVKARKAINA